MTASRWKSDPDGSTAGLVDRREFGRMGVMGLALPAIAGVRTVTRDDSPRALSVGFLRGSESAAPGLPWEKAAGPDEQEHPPTLNLSTPEESLDFLASGPPGFLPGDLDQLLADSESARKLELEAPCQPT